MSAKWTRRRNGSTMTTVRLEAHVEWSLILWISTRTGWSETEALAWYKKQLDSGIIEREQWYRPVFIDGEMVFSHVDGIESARADGGQVYGDGEVKE